MKDAVYSRLDQGRLPAPLTAEEEMQAAWGALQLEFWCIMESAQNADPAALAWALRRISHPLDGFKDAVMARLAAAEKEKSED